MLTESKYYAFYFRTFDDELCCANFYEELEFFFGVDFRHVFGRKEKIKGLMILSIHALDYG